jgi:hypothetical protein
LIKPGPEHDAIYIQKQYVIKRNQLKNGSRKA